MSAQIHVDGSNVVLNTTNGPENGWFALLTKTNLTDAGWTTNQTGLPIDGTGTGWVTNPMTAPREFYKLIESQAPPTPQPPYATSFDSPTFSSGHLNGQDGWVAQTQWQADGAGHVANTSGAFIRAHPTAVLGSTAIGETMTIRSTFTLGAYSPPTNISEIANWEEGIYAHAMSHQQGTQAYDAGLAIHLAFKTSSGEVELRAGQGQNETGTSVVSIGNAAALGGTTFTLDTVFTKTAVDTWAVQAMLDDGTNPVWTLDYIANGDHPDLDTDSDGSGILGGIQALPSGGGSPGVLSPPFGPTTVSDFAIEVSLP
jgi:hypothetical protein